MYTTEPDDLSYSEVLIFDDAGELGYAVFASMLPRDANMTHFYVPLCADRQERSTQRYCVSCTTCLR